MKKVFLDTNVLLDAILGRKDKGVAAAAILSDCELGKTDYCISFLSVANMAYTLKKGRTVDDMKKLVKEYTLFLSVLPMDNAQLQQAYQVEAPDFEDVLQYECANSAGCNVLVTGNVKHFKFVKDIEVVSTMDYGKQYIVKKGNK